MKCVDCRFSHIELIGRITYFCCYPDGIPQFSVALIDGDIPEWCPYKKDKGEENEHNDSKQDPD